MCAKYHKIKQFKKLNLSGEIMKAKNAAIYPPGHFQVLGEM